METENTVSIWIGNFETLESLNKYIELTYDDEGEVIQSDFYKDYDIDIDDIDEDFIEKAVIANKTSDIRELLAGASYDDFILNNLNLSQKFEDSNSIILLYNYSYEGNIKSSDNTQYIDTVKYR